jgi:hypothetical protein
MGETVPVMCDMTAAKGQTMKNDHRWVVKATLIEIITLSSFLSLLPA